MEGYIKLYRKVQEHWIWQDEKYLKYWFTILLNVNHSAAKFPVNGDLFDCLPGQSFRSLQSWTDLFGCSKKTTLKFFSLLENDRMITRKTIGNGNRRKSLLTVVNWKDYQITETENSTERKPETPPKGNRKVTPNNNDKNKENKENDNLYNSEISKIPFSEFWELYNKKKDKKVCEPKWNKLSLEDQAAILEYLPAYIASTPDKQFRKDPETFLNRRAWENEIIKPTPSISRPLSKTFVNHDSDF